MKYLVITYFHEVRIRENKPIFIMIRHIVQPMCAKTFSKIDTFGMLLP